MGAYLVGSGAAGDLTASNILLVEAPAGELCSFTAKVRMPASLLSGLVALITSDW